MTPARKRQVLEDYGKVCAECGASLSTKVEIDHRIQLWLGGPEERENLRPLCIPCHTAKTADDAKIRAKVKRIIAREDGTRRHRKAIPSRGFQKVKRPLRSRGFGKTRERNRNER